METVPVSSVQLSKGISVVEALPSVHAHLLGPWLQSKVSAYVPL